MPTINLLEIDVKADHIARASLALWIGEGFPLGCPLVQAISEVLPGYEVEVRGNTFGIREISSGREYYGTLRKDAVKFVDAWDTRETRANVKPAKVWLECPFTLIPNGQKCS